MENLKEKVKNNKKIIAIFIIVLLMIISFWFNKNDVLILLKYNIYLIKLLFPFVLLIIFLCFLINHFVKDRIKLGDYLTFSSIIIVVAFFAIQFHIDKEAEVNRIKKVNSAMENFNKIDCLNSNNINSLFSINIERSVNDQLLPLEKYSLDFYENNIDFIYNSKVKQEADKIIEAFRMMKISNELIDYINNLNTLILSSDNVAEKNQIISEKEKREFELGAYSDVIYWNLQCNN